MVGVCLTSNLALAEGLGNILLTADVTGLPKDSVVNRTQIVTADKGSLSEYIGFLDASTMERVNIGLRQALGL